MSVWLQFNELVVPCEGGNPSEKSNGTLPASLKGDVISSSFQQWSKLKMFLNIMANFVLDIWFSCVTHTWRGKIIISKGFFFFHHIFQTFLCNFAPKPSFRVSCCPKVGW